MPEPPACDALPRRKLVRDCTNRLTPLHVASCINGTAAVVALLLTHGADVHAKERSGCVLPVAVSGNGRRAPHQPWPSGDGTNAMRMWMHRQTQTHTHAHACIYTRMHMHASIDTSNPGPYTYVASADVTGMA